MQMPAGRDQSSADSEEYGMVLPIDQGVESRADPDAVEDVENFSSSFGNNNSSGRPEGSWTVT
jgi:hypothetical protein